MSSTKHNPKLINGELSRPPESNRRLFQAGTRVWATGRELAVSYSNIVYLNDARLGACVLALTFFKPNVGLCGLIAGSLCFAFRRLMGSGKSSLAFSSATLNAILVGLVLGTMVKLDPASAALLAVASFLAFCLTHFCFALLSPYGIPVLSLPFSIVSSLITYAVPKYSNLYHWHLGTEALTLELGAPSGAWGELAAGFGNLIAVSSPVAGLLLLALVLYRSPITFLFAVFGSVSGAVLQLFLGSPAAMHAHLPISYNDALTAMAVGAIYLVPSLKTNVLALFAVGLAMIIGDAFRVAGIPVFTLPFFLTLNVVLMALRHFQFKDLATGPDATAEANLERRLASTYRFQLDKVQVGHPLCGRWKISQGTEGRFTHQYPWHEALDFVGVGKDGKTHGDRGQVLNDYYAFGRPVFSPVYGYVHDLVNHLPDCAAGQVDTSFPWGNHLVVRTLDGLFVVLAHLKQDSILVRRGEYLTEGMSVAAVGNSGYSPEPHLHLHVQTTATIGSPTVPYSFVSYHRGTEISFGTLPREGEEIELPMPEPQGDPWLSFVLDQKFIFTNESNPSEVHELNVAMESGSGTFYLEDQLGNRLHFSRNRHYFCFFRYEGGPKSFLAALFAALPRYPHSARPGMAWSERLPVALAYPGALRWLVVAATAWGKPLRTKEGNFALSLDGAKISGDSYSEGRRCRTSLDFDSRLGILRVTVGARTYRKR